MCAFKNTLYLFHHRHVHGRCRQHAVKCMGAVGKDTIDESTEYATKLAKWRKQYKKWDKDSQCRWRLLAVPPYNSAQVEYNIQHL